MSAPKSPVRPTCPHCAKRPRTGSGDNVNPTCGNSACQEAEYRANALRSTLRKRRTLTPEPFNWQELRAKRGGIIEIDAVPVVPGNEHVVTRGLFKLAAHGRDPGTFAALDRNEVTQIRDRMTAWLTATESVK